MCERFFLAFCFFKQNKSTLLFSLILNMNNEAKETQRVQAQFGRQLKVCLKKKKGFLVAKKLYHELI